MTNNRPPDGKSVQPLFLNDDDNELQRTSEASLIQQYRQVEQWCRDQISTGQDFLFDPILFRVRLKTASKELSFPLQSLDSFFRSLHVQHIKETIYRMRKHLFTYLEEFCNNQKSIRQIAQENNHPPYLLAKMIVEEVANLSGKGKKGLINAMRDPTQELRQLDSIRDQYRDGELEWMVSAQQAQGTKGEFHSSSSNVTRLAAQVKEAVDCDPFCGPYPDRTKHFVGIEYEVVLEHILKERGIPYETESQLRQKGASKTPDVVLSCPIAVQVEEEWRIVTWIDSKATYGDVATHHQSVMPQCQSYIHRYGPGLVLYFFGHAPLSLLGDANGDIVIIGWELPEASMWPTGSIDGRSNEDDEKRVDDSIPANYDE